MIGPIRRWRMRRDVNRVLQEDATRYRALIREIRELQQWCSRDYPEIEAATLWLLRSDVLRRWEGRGHPPGSARWWGPIETFHGQLNARFRRRKQS